MFKESPCNYIYEPVFLKDNKYPGTCPHSIFHQSIVIKLHVFSRFVRRSHFMSPNKFHAKTIVYGKILYRNHSVRTRFCTETIKY